MASREQFVQPQEPEQTIEDRVDLDPRLRQGLGRSFEVDPVRIQELIAKRNRGERLNIWEQEELGFWAGGGN